MMDASAGSQDGIRFWFQKNQHMILAVSIVSITLLFFLHLFTTVFQAFSQEIVAAVQIVAVLLIALVLLPIVWKGAVPLLLCAIGIVLLYSAVILPYYGPRQTDSDLGEMLKYTLFTRVPVNVAASMHFFLGLVMVGFGMIVAYRPSLLFTKNRPAPLESQWSKYPVWHHNMLIANYNEDVLPVKRLMTDQEKYLAWRYEYVLAEINHVPYLVGPETKVPRYSTRIIRDKESGLAIGKARYSGFFI